MWHEPVNYAGGLDSMIYKEAIHSKPVFTRQQRAVTRDQLQQPAVKQAAQQRKPRQPGTRTVKPGDAAMQQGGFKRLGRTRQGYSVWIRPVDTD